MNTQTRPCSRAAVPACSIQSLDTIVDNSNNVFNAISDAISDQIKLLTDTILTPSGTTVPTGGAQSVVLTPTEEEVYELLNEKGFFNAHDSENDKYSFIKTFVENSNSRYNISSDKIVLFADMLYDLETYREIPPGFSTLPDNWFDYSIKNHFMDINIGIGYVKYNGAVIDPDINEAIKSIIRQEVRTELLSYVANIQ
jgi:hypothetical protein